jgi:hypothetical protein
MSDGLNDSKIIGYVKRPKPEPQVTVPVSHGAAYNALHEEETKESVIELYLTSLSENRKLAERLGRIRILCSRKDAPEAILAEIRAEVGNE